MSGEKFTKGEWVVYLSDDSEQIVIGADSYNEDPSEYFSCHKMLVDCDADDEEAVANAHLIAAAPEMYYEIERDIEELTELISTLKPYSVDYLFYSQELLRKQALLAKARGEA